MSASDDGTGPVVGEPRETGYSVAPRVAIVAAVILASIGYALLRRNGLEHTSLVFMGIPALVALAVAAMPPAKSITGTIVRALTIALALAAVFFGEGFVCILFAAPLFYGVGIVIGLLADYVRVWRRGDRSVRVSLCVFLLFGPASLEGVVPGFEFDRHAEVTRMRVVAGTPRQVEAALAETPRFTQPLPTFLQLRFPTPGMTNGAGLDVGDERRVEFPYAGHHSGSLTLRVTRHTPGHVTFEPIADDSHIIHWLSWRTIDVEWREIGAGKTEVSWTLRYRRRLDPAWYFDPLERHGVGLVAGYLIDNVATPRPRALTPSPTLTSIAETLPATCVAPAVVARATRPVPPPVGPLTASPLAEKSTVVAPGARR